MSRLGVWPRGISMALLCAAVLASRLFLRPDGPWEQDEAIFAAGVVDFDLARHRPHPPGFPGWIFLGKLLFPVVGDGLLALRLWSCAASLLTFVLVNALLRRLVSPNMALLAASLYTFLPGVWFHAPRGFSTTPALALALLAMWLWLRASQGSAQAAAHVPREHALGGAARSWISHAGWVSLAASLTVRPQLAPTLCVLALLGVWLGRARPRRLALGMVLASCVATIAAGWVVVDSGGLGRTLEISWSHLGDSVRTSRWPGVRDLSVVRAMGGIIAASMWSFAALVGTWRLFAVGRLRGGWLLAVALVSIVSIVGLHPPTFPRYAILPLLATLPAVAIAVDWIWGRWGTWLLGGLTILTLSWTTPAMLAAHRTPLPVVAALRDLGEQARDLRPIVYSHELFSFVRNEVMHGRLKRDTIDLDRLRRRKTLPHALDRPFVFLAGDANWLPGATQDRRSYASFPAAAWSLSQRRFDEAHLFRGAPLLLAAAREAVEFNSRDEPYIWLGDTSEFLVPIGAETLVLILDVDRNHGPLRLDLRCGKQTLLTEHLGLGTHRVAIPLAGCEGPRRLRLGLTREGSEGARGGLRARIYGAWCEGPGFRRRQVMEVSPGRPLAALAAGVELSGVFRPEVFGPDRRPGAWTDGHARVGFSAGPGLLEVTFAQPPPRDPLVRVGVRGPGGSEISVDLAGGSRPITHQLRLHGEVPRDIRDPTRDREEELRIDLEILGATHRPSSDHPTSADHRELGPILFEIRFVPEAREREF